MARLSLRRAALALITLTFTLTLTLAQGNPIKCPSHLSWTLLPTANANRFRGLAALSATTAWVAGTNATVLRTTDAGASFAPVGPRGLPPADAGLQFRDVAAFDARRAIVLAIGASNASRILATADGGASWAAAFVNRDPDAFYDCLAFADARAGWAVSDPVGGRFRLLRTADGGRTWAAVDPAGMPPALAGEFAFAASGTCLAAGPGGRLYLASGGADPGRVFRSADGGGRWEVAGTPLKGGEAAGVFSVQFRDERHGVVVGGDYTLPNATGGNAAWSSDGGETWTASESFPAGYRSGVAWIPGRNAAVAVGPSGSDISFDGGRHWRSFSNESFDSVECPTPKVCWASGEKGRVARLDL
jgi:photosystem II stability/assembly factor-like uncharacterized protein